MRLAFRSREGRYIPPYGHRTEINDGWFQDYGADVKLMDTSFAYVDGTFQVELPVGEIYLEMTKGFEFQPVRKKLDIEPGQRELNLEISRLADFRSRGWVTADTHVHFLSPSTAILEGQAEGLNLINLLAAQWGDLFTMLGTYPTDHHFKGWRDDGLGGDRKPPAPCHPGLLRSRPGRSFPCRPTDPARATSGDPFDQFGRLDRRLSQA